LKDIAHVAETRSKTVEEITASRPKEKAAASEATNAREKGRAQKKTPSSLQPTEHDGKKSGGK